MNSESKPKILSIHCHHCDIMYVDTIGYYNIMRHREVEVIERCFQVCTAPSDSGLSKSERESNIYSQGSPPQQLEI